VPFPAANLERPRGHQRKPILQAHAHAMADSVFEEFAGAWKHKE
jgi:hypothetical protein